MKERWGRTNKENTNATYETTDAQTKNYNRGTALEPVSKKTTEGVGVGVLKPVLLSRNLTIHHENTPI